MRIKTIRYFLLVVKAKPISFMDNHPQKRKIIHTVDTPINNGIQNFGIFLGLSFENTSLLLGFIILLYVDLI